MAAVKPVTSAELARLHGMGEKKMERYGRIFLEAIALHADA
jgi:superfamily II DNA helicase RecQ